MELVLVPGLLDFELAVVVVSEDGLFVLLFEIKILELVTICLGFMPGLDIFLFGVVLGLDSGPCCLCWSG